MFIHSIQRAIVHSLSTCTPSIYNAYSFHEAERKAFCVCFVLLLFLVNFLGEMSSAAKIKLLILDFVFFISDSVTWN